MKVGFRLFTFGLVEGTAHLSTVSTSGTRGTTSKTSRFVRRLCTVALAIIGVAAPIRAQHCDKSLWNHVYNPARLQVVNQCMEVKGTIRDMRVEKDGDYHIQLTLDGSQPASLVNGRNKQVQHGCLVLEPICKGRVTQADAIQPCAGTPKIKVPAIGSHVSVVGSFVKDTEGNHGWMEIHPVTRITVIP
jgi:hypothetical protein